VIDFAYAVHTEIGDTCVGAKINGRLSTIRTKLKQGDKIEVLTDPNRKPSSDWLYCSVTSKALTRIRSFLRKEERIESEKLGKALFNEKIKKLGRRPTDVLRLEEFKEFLAKSGFQTIDSYYVHLGYGKENINDLENVLLKPKQTRKSIGSRRLKVNLSENPAKTAVQIAGIENMMVRYANCCNPIKGDKIVGLVIRGQGVSIHLEDCENIKSRKYDPERLINVDWVKSSSEKLPVSIHITFDNLIKTNHQIMKILASTKVILVENNLKLVNKTTIQDLTIKVDNIEQLGRILKRLNMLQSVRATRNKETVLPDVSQI
jgi:GTP pyrophosphokinase